MSGLASNARATSRSSSVSFGGRPPVRAARRAAARPAWVRSRISASPLARAEWLENRRSELLTTPYFHVVFTVPQEIAAIAHYNKGPVYNIT
jgi:hypothetical protein